MKGKIIFHEGWDDPLPDDIWEIAIKVRAGKLAVTGEHMKAYLDLPALHKDPFDHMLIAQAISSLMRLITGDSFLAGYSSLVMVV